MWPTNLDAAVACHPPYPKSGGGGRGRRRGQSGRRRRRGGEAGRSVAHLTRGSGRREGGGRTDYRVSVALLGPSQVLSRYEDRKKGMDGWTTDRRDDVPRSLGDESGISRIDSKSPSGGRGLALRIRQIPAWKMSFDGGDASQKDILRTIDEPALAASLRTGAQK